MFLQLLLATIPLLIMASAKHHNLTHVNTLGEILKIAEAEFSPSDFPSDIVQKPDPEEAHQHSSLKKHKKKKVRRANKPSLDMKDVHVAIATLDKVLKQAENELEVSDSEMDMLLEHPDKVEEVGGVSYYNIYEESRAEKTKKNKIVYRVKSLDVSRPKSCSSDGNDAARVVCPTSKGNRWWVCVSSDDLCDGTIDCPNGEDENSVFCMFHKAKTIPK